MSIEQNTPSGIDWRYTAKKVRLGPFDAFVVGPPLGLFAANIEIWTLLLAMFIIVLMWIVEMFFRMPLPIALRSLRAFLAGPRRPAVSWRRVRRL